MTGKTFMLAALAGSATAQWWGGAPSCAQPCVSSQFATISATTAWPSPSAFCNAGSLSSVSSCLARSCSATPTAVASYSSMASSLCAQWSSCSAAGSTGVYTITRTGATAFATDVPTTTATPVKRQGFGGGGGAGFSPGFGGGAGFPSSFTGGALTVTGCQWNGSPWMGGAGGAGGAGWGGWGDWGAAWTWATHTATVTRTVTQSDGRVVLSTGLAQVAEAVSGSVTSTTTLTGSATATATGSSSSGISSSGARGADLHMGGGVVLLASVFGGVLGVMLLL